VAPAAVRSRRESSGGQSPPRLTSWSKRPPGCHLVDVELETPLISSPGLRQAAPVSQPDSLFHDFPRHPEAGQTFEKMKKYPADFFKIVSHRNSLYDNVVMMKFLRKHSHAHSMIGICMGEQGVISRILAVRAEASYFCRCQSRRRNGPGPDCRAHLARDLSHRAGGPATRVYGVAGDPIAHSLSPIIAEHGFPSGKCERCLSDAPCQEAGRPAALRS